MMGVSSRGERMIWILPLASFEWQIEREGIRGKNRAPAPWPPPPLPRPLINHSGKGARQGRGKDGMSKRRGAAGGEGKRPKPALTGLDRGSSKSGPRSIGNSPFFGRRAAAPPPQNSLLSPLPRHTAASLLRRRGLPAVEASVDAKRARRFSPASALPPSVRRPISPPPLIASKGME